MLKRYLFVASLLIFSAASASADYILVKINVNQLNFFPETVPLPAVGQPMPMPMPMPPDGGVVPPPGDKVPVPKLPSQPFGSIGQPDPSLPKDPNPKWLHAWVEIKGRPTAVGLIPGGLGHIVQVSHKWGKKMWAPVSPMYPFFVEYQYVEDKAAKKWDEDFRNAQRDRARSIDTLLELARKALERGRHDKFHAAMKEVTEAAPNHQNAKFYSDVKKALAKPFNNNDPAQLDLIKELTSSGFKAVESDQRHFTIYAAYFPTDKVILPTAKRRLAMMEETLEAFYYWFAVQKVEPRQPLPIQPGIPKHRLIAVMYNDKSDFLAWNEKWGFAPIVGDGFTPRRDNIVVMATKPRVMDPVYQEFAARILPEKIADANTKLQPFNITLTPEDLLSGKINDTKGAGYVAIYIGAAQTATLLCKTLEEQAERATLTNQVVRQLLTASGALPRNVQVPDWMVEGLAALFESPAGAVYQGSVGSPNINHATSFKHLCGGNRRGEPYDVLYNLVTDQYFQRARKYSADLLENKDDAELRMKEREEWETARCTAWSFMYFLAQNDKLDLIFRYGKELDSLPRDLDLSESLMQRSFAKAFEMADPKDPHRIATVPLKNMADAWFSAMQGLNIDLPPEVQTYFQQERGKLGGPAAAPPVEVPPAKGGGNSTPETKPAPGGVNPTPAA